MEKKVFLILFLLLVPTVIASTLFDDWVDDEETFKVGSHYFYVSYIESNANLIFKMDDMGGIMSIGECETRENIMYCLEDINYPQIKVKIDSLEPDISIERSFSTTSPYLNEEVKVTVTLKNEGDKRAENVKYMDIYGKGFVIAGRNYAVWEGSLNSGEEETFTYTVRAEEIVSFDSKATLSYKFEGKEKTRESSVVEIEVQKPFSIDAVISEESAEKNEIIDYNLTIKNNDQSNKLSIEDLEISIPIQVELIDFSNELKKENDKLTFKGEIEKEKRKNFAIKVRSNRVGTFTIQASADIRISDKHFKEKLEKGFTIGLSRIVPILNMTDTVNSNSPYDVYIALKNYAKEEIKDVNITVESDLFEDIKEKRDIPSYSTSDIFKKTLVAPYTEEDKKYNVRVRGSYISSSKKYTFEKSAKLSVKAAPNIIKILKEFNKEEFYLGEEIRVAVKIKNQKNEVINEIDASDIFPVELRSSLLGDVVGYLDTLNNSEEKSLYSYSILIPEDYKEEEIEFKTVINAKLNDELNIIKRIDKVKVIPRTESVKKEEEQKKEAEEIETQEEEIGEGITEEIFEEETEEPKENFFRRVLSWIKSLFSKK